jgi:energy-coupling factor transport system substrate-specific component
VVNMRTNPFSKIFIALTALASLTMFAWPLLIQTTSADENRVAQTVFILLMPLMLVLVLVEFASGGLDSKQLAMLGVLTALNAVIRILGAGTSGIETAFFLIIIGAFVFGSGFGFLLGSGSLLVSALLMGGVGPWLPFQMMAAGLLGLAAGLLPKPKARWLELVTLVTFAILGSYAYGALMTLWNWPFLLGVGTDISYLPGAGFFENIIRFFKYELLTGGLLWDTGRAITTSVLILVTAPALLTTLKRAARRAGIAR